MSKKFYSIFEVEEFRKRYQGKTDTQLKRWGYNYGADSLGGMVELTTPDDQTPDLNQLFLVTIEPIDKDSLKSDNTYDWMQKFFKALREKDANENSGMKTGRKFR